MEAVSAIACRTVKHALKQTLQALLEIVMRTLVRFAKMLNLRLEGGACGH
jgi:hypothetical protein